MAVNRLTHVVILILIGVIGLNYLILPMVNLFHPAKILDLPTAFWTLTSIVIPSHLGTEALNIHLPNVLDKLTNKQSSDNK